MQPYGHYGFIALFLYLMLAAGRAGASEARWKGGPAGVEHIEAR